MINIVLLEPEIPPNTGNIIRLCANTGCSLHLIKPLGFELDDKRMRRAGLDYQEWASVKVYNNLEQFRQQMGSSRLLAATTKGGTAYHQVNFCRGDSIIFGPETRGLPQALLDQMPPEHRLRIPMKNESRSLNLSNAAAILAYEALRQLNFEGLS